MGGSCRWGEGATLQQNVLTEDRDQEPAVVGEEDGWGWVHTDRKNKVERYVVPGLGMGLIW